MDAFDRALASVQKDNASAKKVSNNVNISLLVEYCPNCGAPTSNVTCEYCDSMIPIKKPVAPPVINNNEIFCSSCGEKIKSTAEFCQKCGTRQRTQEPVTYYNNDNNDDNVAATAAGVAAGFVAGAVVKNVASDILDSLFS